MTTYRHEAAFPATEYFDEKPIGSCLGLSKREFFTAIAFHALIVADGDRGYTAELLAVVAVDNADALVEALNKA